MSAKPRGQYCHRVVGDVVEFWLWPMPPDDVTGVSVWVEDTVKGHLVHEIHKADIPEVIAVLTLYKYPKRGRRDEPRL